MNAQFPRKFFAWFAMLALLTGILATGPTVFAAGKKMKKISVTSTAFKNGGNIPLKYAFTVSDIPGGENVSIPLAWKVNKKTAKKIKSFAISIIDLHPIAQKCVHLIAYDLPADTRMAEEGIFSSTAPIEGAPAMRVTESCLGTNGYGGPAPPPDSGPHVYEIIVYGLKVEKLDGVPFTASASDLKKAIKGKVVAKGKLKGKFTHPADTSDTGMEKTVEITSAGFSPSSLTVSAGQKVKFVNKDTETHWPASDPHPVHTDYPGTGGCIASVFDACAALAKDGEWGFVFNEKGTWRYHDHLNPSLKGTVIVE